MQDDFKTQSLNYHRLPIPGKLEVVPTKALATQHDLALAYSPGVAFACESIVKDPYTVSELTARSNLVGLITNGTAILGLGAIGPLAGKPVMEGKAVLFKKFAGVNVFDLEIDERDPDKLVEIIASLEPTFGGIHLEDIKAPECFYIENALSERMGIPVFHDDQHGTAIIMAAALLNALLLVGKQIEDIQVVCSGAGAAGIACLNMLVKLGAQKEKITLIDSQGVVFKGRSISMNVYKAAYAIETEKRTLSEAMDNADFFLGVSSAGVLTVEMLKKMAPDPIVFALANPEPEIRPEVARMARPDAIIATGRSDYPNQVNNVLCFPYIFRGALDCGARVINEAMKLACVDALATLTRQAVPTEVIAAYGGQPLTFGREYLIPKPFDARLITTLAPAVVAAAQVSGVATRPVVDLESYRAHLCKKLLNRYD